MIVYISGIYHCVEHWTLALLLFLCLCCFGGLLFLHAYLFFGWSLLEDDSAAGVVQQYRDLPCTYLNVKLSLYFRIVTTLGCLFE